jgi:hypothetical protein
MAAGAGTLAFTGAILAAGLGGAGDVRADALCDQMRAQYGPSWPCISVPTYTPPPTMNAPTTTPGAPGTSNGGAVIGGDAGPGPGTGNGTPIVGGQPTDQNRPDRAGGPTGPRTPAPATVTPNRPGQLSGNGQTPGRTQVPAGVPVKQSEQSPSDQAFLSPASDDDGGLIPLPVWAIAGAAAVAAASPRARSLLSRGGSTRATVGPSRMVLIHDESSPTTYRFAMNVPDGGYTKVNPDGSATVYDKDGNAIRQVARPWAFDAAGRPQKTWYTVDENGDLIQHVEPAENALFPILADPTTGDVGGVALDEARGRSEGDSWETPLPNGGKIVNTIPEGNGDQSVHQVIENADGTVASTQDVASNGQGGYQRWATNSDGTSAYRAQDAPGQDIYGASWDAGADPANDTPASTYGQSWDVNHSSTTMADGTVFNSDRQDDGNWTHKNLNTDGSLTLAESGPNGENTHVTGEFDPDGTGWWKKGGYLYEQRTPDGHVFVTPESGGPTIEAWEDNGWLFMRDPATGERTARNQKPDGTITEIVRDRDGKVTGWRIVNRDGVGAGEQIIDGKTVRVTYFDDGSMQFADGESRTLYKPNGDIVQIDPSSDRAYYFRSGESEPYQTKHADGSDLSIADGAEDRIKGAANFAKDMAVHAIWNPLADIAGFNGYEGRARAQDRQSFLQNPGGWVGAFENGVSPGQQWSGYDAGPQINIEDITIGDLVAADAWRQGGVKYWFGSMVGDQLMGAVIPGPMDDLANAGRRAVIPSVDKPLPVLKRPPVNPDSPFLSPNIEGGIFSKSGNIMLNRAYEQWILGSRSLTPHMVKPDIGRGAPTIKLDSHIPELNSGVDIKGLQKMPGAEGRPPTPFQQSVIYPSITKGIAEQMRIAPSNFGPEGGIIIVTGDGFLIRSIENAGLRNQGVVTMSPADFFSLLESLGRPSPNAGLSFPQFLDTIRP